jgi:hypothetical protein
MGIVFVNILSYANVHGHVGFHQDATAFVLRQENAIIFVDVSPIDVVLDHFSFYLL